MPSEKVSRYIYHMIGQTGPTCGCESCRTIVHLSDCAVHNEPAFPNGPCDCGAVNVKEK